MNRILFSLILSIISLVSCQKQNPLGDILLRYDTFQESQKNDDFPWPKIQANDIAKQLHFYKGIQNGLNMITPSSIDQTNLINYEMLKHIVDDKVSNLNYESYLIPITSEGGFVTGMIFSIQNKRLKTGEDLDKFLKRLRTLPAYIDHRISSMQRGLKTGKKSSKLITSKFLNILDPFTSTLNNEDNLFQKAIETYDGEISEEVKSEILQLIGSDIPTSLQKLSSFVRNEYLPNAYDKIGAGQLPQGAEYYQQRVNFFTTLEITPEQIFQTGLSEVARIRLDMEEVIDNLGFKGSWEDFFNFLRTDPQFYAKTPEEILMRAAWICKGMEFEVPKYFGKMPRMPFSVKPVPAAIAPNYTAGRYSGGSYEDHKAGQYWVNTTKLESRPLYALPALSLHEAVPGHHTQNMLAAEMVGLPDFRGNYLSAFGEGWGLYCEYLGIEAGIYKTPYENFGRMTYEMWRACRLVVDVGMHYKGWDRQKAFDFMASNTALSIHEVNTEIDRYIGWPAQAVSYKIGELKIRELRKMAEETLGEKFDIRAFHDKVLENGSIPLSTLERIVNQYVESVKNST
ncbi:MAG: DUF885 domain-containing protein [Saprospiraceae bacterium]